MTTATDALGRLEANHLIWRLTLYEDWLTDTADRLVPDGPHHTAFWDWLWAIEPGIRPPAYLSVWSRGGAKSTNVELGTVALGARRRRRYGWYVSDTQSQADDHVGSIAALLEHLTFAAFYPGMARRRVGKFGSSRGWRRNRLRTADGFTIDAMGLDTARRGVKLEADRPDLMIFDDIDDTHDSPDIVDRKLATITKSLIPAGAEDLAIMGVQNLIHPDSIFAQLLDGRAEILADRIVSGPIPALTNYRRHRNTNPNIVTSSGEPRRYIIHGTPTWAGQDLETCQAIVDAIGPTEFESENQHIVESPAGGIYNDIEWNELHRSPEDVPDLVRTTVWVDPAVTKTDKSDSQAIQADGIDAAGDIYRLFSWEQQATPLAAIELALRTAADLQAEHVGIETDQGGDTWESVFIEAQNNTGIRHIPMVQAKAGQGHGPKIARSQRMHTDYEMIRIWHVDNGGGAIEVLEPALKRFPKTPPLDLADAAYWSWADLRSQGAIHGDSFAGRGREEEREIRDAYTAPRPSILAAGGRRPPTDEDPPPPVSRETPPVKHRPRRRPIPGKNPLKPKKTP